MNQDEIPPVAPAQPVTPRPQQYWFDPKRGKAWKYDGTYGGDEEFIRLADIDEMLPILDILPRLLAKPDAVIELMDAAKDIRDNPGADCHGSVGFCAIELPKLARLRDALAVLDSSP